MNTHNTTSLPNCCDGCDKKCKYGYTRTPEGKVLPTIAGETQEYFIRPDGNIVSTVTSSPVYAQQIANMIAQTCSQYKR